MCAKNNFEMSALVITHTPAGERRRAGPKPLLSGDKGDDRPRASSFQPGDRVFLVRGTYQGTSGIFLGLREDRRWADIEEPGGVVRSHPVAWLGDSFSTARPVGGDK